MSAVEWVLGAATLGFGSWLVSALVRLRREREKAEALRAALEAGRTAGEQAIQLARQAIAEAQEQAALAARYFACIQGIESERDEWKGIAGTNVALYAGGLEACLAEIQRLSFAAKTEVNPVFAGIVQTYQKRRDLTAEQPPVFDPAKPIGEFVAQVEAYRQRHKKVDTPEVAEKLLEK